MKKHLFFLTILFSLSATAQNTDSSAVIAQDNCETLIALAEQTQDTDVYTKCGFDDKIRAFEYWGPYVSNKNYKKALFELAKRHPEHVYADLYTQKSATAGYGPAILKTGHTAFNEGREDDAIALYKKALQIGGLTSEEQAQIAEKMGLIYLNPDRADADFNKGILFIKQAANNRQALSNNILAFYTYSGAHGFQKNDREALNYFWRAILLDCPAAQENVGVFHLERLKKIDRPTAIGYMQERLTSCKSPSSNELSPLEKAQQDDFIKERNACDCGLVMETAERLKRQPYILLGIENDFARLSDSMGREHMVQAGQSMMDGTKVLEVRQTAAIISKGDKRFVLNLYPKKCADLCAKPLPADNGTVRIKPYHISFTEQECLDLLAYARELVDMEKPFFGKKECFNLETKQQNTDDILSLLNQTETPKTEAAEEKEPEEEKTVGITFKKPTPISMTKKEPTLPTVAEEIREKEAVKKADIEEVLGINQPLPKKKKKTTPQRLNPLNQKKH